MAKHRLMEITIADSVSPEVETLVEKWNEALSATLEYMEQHKPSSLGFTATDQLVFDLPMVAYLSFLVPLVHDADDQKAVLASVSDKLLQRFYQELREYSSKRSAGLIL